MPTTIERVSWTQTFSGRAVDLPDPHPDQIDLVDIAVSLSRQPRYNGHTREVYSVAQHSVLASLICPYPLAALLHDASEAYLGDIITPVKRLLGAKRIRDLEGRVMRGIWRGLGLGPCQLDDPEVARAVKLADLTMYALEKEQLLEEAPRPWGLDLPEQLPDVTIVSWSETEARDAFLERYRELTVGQSST